MLRNKFLVSIGLLAFSVAAFTVEPVLAQDKLRISLDTNPTHVRNKTAGIFAAELKKRVGDKISVEIYPSAQLFRDRDVPKALRQGAIEMGIPGTWQLDGFEPNAAIQTLPMFYGASLDVVHQVMDGKLGQFINKHIEDRLKVVIPGGWLDLGMQYFYSNTKPLDTYADFKGMKVRYPGGSANAARLEGLGIVPMLVPYPDLPMALSQGVVDGVASTNESIATAKLWDSGIKYSFEDGQFLAQYVPMISSDFWKKQSKDVQDAIKASWQAATTQGRGMAAKAQDLAREQMIQHGIKVVVPKPADVAAVRKSLMPLQDGLVKKMKIDPKSVEIALEELKAAKVEY